MRKLRNFTFIAGLLVLAFGLLANYVPGITITEFVWGFCVGFATAMLAAAIGFAIAPVFCKKKKCCEDMPENTDTDKK